MGERTIAPGRWVPRIGIHLLSGVLVVGAMAAPASAALGGGPARSLDPGPATTTSASATTSPTTAQVLRNHDFSAGRASWHPGDRARLAVQQRSSRRALVVKNHSRRTRDVAAQSSSSLLAFPAGTRVTVTAPMAQQATTTASMLPYSLGFISLSLMGARLLSVLAAEPDHSLAHSPENGTWAVRAKSSGLGGAARPQKIPGQTREPRIR